MRAAVSPFISRDNFLKDVIEGLSSRPKRLPSKYFYDERGSELFEKISQTPEYYPTRVETAILAERAAEMAECFADIRTIIEPGSGASAKTRLILENFPAVDTYIPVDISADFMEKSADKLRGDFPWLEVLPVAADFTTDFSLPSGRNDHALVFFPGSTIGNFTPDEARSLLEKMAEIAGPRGDILVGVDLKKDREVLERAYNDADGWTRAFNLNLIERLSRELGVAIDVEDFEHRAFYNSDEGRIEMHLASLARQTLRIMEQAFVFQKDESILTEYSYKYTLDQFAALGRSAGLAVRHVWIDPDGLFSVQHLAACL